MRTLRERADKASTQVAAAFALDQCDDPIEARRAAMGREARGGLSPQRAVGGRGAAEPIEHRQSGRILMQRQRGDGRLGETPGCADVQRLGAGQPVEVFHAFGRGDAGQPRDRRATGVHRAVIADRAEAFQPAVNESGQNHERRAALETDWTARWSERGRTRAVRTLERLTAHERVAVAPGRAERAVAGDHRHAPPDPRGRSARARRGDFTRDRRRGPRFHAAVLDVRALPFGCAQGKRREVHDDQGQTHIAASGRNSAPATLAPPNQPHAPSNQPRTFEPAHLRTYLIISIR